MSELDNYFKGGEFDESGRYKEEEKKSRKKPERKVDEGRRNFIKKTGLAAAGLILESALGPVEALAGGGRHEQSEKDFEEERIINNLKVFRNELNTFLVEKTGNVSGQNRRTRFEKGYLRKHFQENFQEKFLFLLEDIKNNASERLKNYSPLFHNDLFALLKQFEVHGLYVSFLRENKLASDKHLEGYSKGIYYYSIRSEDYLPDGETIGDNEIEPRYNVLSSSLFSEESKDITRKNLEENPGWSSEEKKKAFKYILSLESVRSKIKENGLILAEAYSLIKAIISKFKLEGHNINDINKEEYRDGIDTATEDLISEQEEFKKEVIIGPDTDHFVSLNYVDPEDPERFSGKKLEKIARSAGVDESKITTIKGDKTSHPSDLENEIQRSILKSDGNVVLFFNTHGLKNALTLKPRGIAESNTGIADLHLATELAGNLIHKIFLTKDPNCLKNFKIIIDSCSSHDFAENLIRALQKMYMENDYVFDGERKTLKDLLGVDITDIPLPTIITSTQEGSLGYFAADIDDSLEDRLEVYAKEGGVTGEEFLTEAQPRMYRFSDMTIFKGKKCWPTEIGKDIGTELPDTMPA